MFLAWWVVADHFWVVASMAMSDVSTPASFDDVQV